ncbi:MAG: aldehyde dehydrogenase family protein [Planctomycetota bacterium]
MPVFDSGQVSDAAASNAKRLSILQVMAGNAASTPTPMRARLAWLRTFRSEIAAEASHLARLMHREIDKPEEEALSGDIMALLAACTWLERNAARYLRPRRVGGRALWQLGQKHSITRAPLGTVGIIATWNYPVQLLGIQLMQALVAGNRVIVKPSEHVPDTQARLLELASKAGLSEGTLRWTEATREAGGRMLEEHDLDHLVFTGSTGVGRIIAGELARKLTPSTLELSGRDSAFVLADADPELAAAAVWNGVTMNAGQTCMAPRRALVDARVYPRFLKALAPLASGARPRALITPFAAETCFSLASGAIAAGGRSLSGVAEPPTNRTLRPLAIVDCPRDAPLVAGDHFGPVIAVVPTRSIDDALAIHRSCDQHLATSIYTRNRRSARTLAERLGASNVTINDTILPTAHPATPIGGHGASGWGLSYGVDGLLQMTRPVVVSTTSSRIRIPLHRPAEPRRLLQAIGFLYGRSRTPSSTPDDAANAPSPERPSVLGSATTTP